MFNERPPHTPSQPISFPQPPVASLWEESLSKQMGLCENTALIWNLRQKDTRRLGCLSHRGHTLLLSFLFPDFDLDPSPLHLIRNVGGKHLRPSGLQTLSEMDKNCLGAPSRQRNRCRSSAMLLLRVASSVRLNPPECVCPVCIFMQHNKITQERFYGPE